MRIYALAAPVIDNQGTIIAKSGTNSSGFRKQIYAYRRKWSGYKYKS